MYENFIDVVIEWINKPWIGTAIGFFVAAFFYCKSKKKASPKAQFHRFPIVSPKKDEVIDDIEIFYKDSKVNSLYRTNIIFWNDGTKTLKRSDIEENDPIIFEFEENNSILRYEIIKETRKAIRCELSPFGCNNSAVELNFSFLDPNDGVNIEILHTGEYDPKIKGTIIGIKEGVKIVNKTSKENLIIANYLERKKVIISKVMHMFLFLMSLLTSIISGFFYYAEMNNAELVGKSILESSKPIMFLSLIYACIFGISLYLFRRRYPLDFRSNSSCYFKIFPNI